MIKLCDLSYDYNGGQNTVPTSISQREWHKDGRIKYQNALITSYWVLSVGDFFSGKLTEGCDMYATIYLYTITNDLLISGPYMQDELRQHAC